MRFDSQFWRMNCQINELSNFSTASLQVNGFDGIGVGARLPLTGLPDLLPIIVILAPKKTLQNSYKRSRDFSSKS